MYVHLLKSVQQNDQVKKRGCAVQFRFPDVAPVAREDAGECQDGARKEGVDQLPVVMTMRKTWLSSPRDFAPPTLASFGIDCRSLCL